MVNLSCSSNNLTSLNYTTQKNHNAAISFFSSAFVSMADLELVYWPGFTGRAEPIIFLLESAGMKYTLSHDVMGFKAQHPEVFACPFIKRGDFVQSQTTAILAYLGQVAGYQLERKDEAYALNVSLNLGDIWTEAYNGRKADDHGAAFLADRLGKWLDVLEAGLNARGGKHFVGDKLSYVDFQALNVATTLEYMYGQKALDPISHRPKLAAALAAVKALPGVDAYLKSDRFLPVLYAGVSAQ
jgi:glutathione S-transferase